MGARWRACIPTTLAFRALRTATSSVCLTSAEPALAGVVLTERIRRGVVQLPTGAWYDPVDPGEDKPLCVHGNPNVLTRDIGTSALAQGCTGQLTTVRVERFRGNLPPIQAHDPPATRPMKTTAAMPRNDRPPRLLCRASARERTGRFGRSATLRGACTHDAEGPS